MEKHKATLSKHANARQSVASKSWKKQDPPPPPQSQGSHTTVHKDDKSEAEKKMLMSSYSKLRAEAEDSKALHPSKPNRIGAIKSDPLQDGGKDDE
jgi:hypothetical protein